MRERGLPGASPTEMVAFMKELSELETAVYGTDAAFHEAEEHLGGIREALLRSMAPDSSLGDQARAIERRLRELHDLLGGTETRESHGDPGPVTVYDRLQTVSIGNFLSTYGPTTTHRRQVEIAAEEFETLHTEFTRLIEVDLVALEQSLESAGVPWTPGRGVPGR